MQFLTENSNLISDLTGSKDSIVHWAATCGLSEHLSRFLDEFPELLEAINIVGETPLICAARHGNAICVGELVLRGAEVDHVSFTGETALHWLASFPDEVVEVIGALLVTPKSLVCYALARKQTPTIAVTGLTVVPGTPLQRAVALRRNTVVEFLLNGGANCFSPGLVGYDEDALQEAGVARNYEVPDAHGMAFLPIHRACQAHDDKMIQLLLDHGPIKLPGWACQTGQPRGIRDALNVDQDDGLGAINYLSYSLLGYACEPISRFSRMCIHGPRQADALGQTFELLLSKSGQTLDRVSFTGKSALLAACLSGDTELVLHILSLPGCHSTLEKSFIGGWGKKPLHVAALQSNLVISEALLDAGADILAESSSGQTAILFCAASFLPDQDVSRLLLSREPKLAAMESYWDSPFSAAVRNHDFSCARLLLEFGADPNQLLHGTSTTLFQVLAAEHDITAVRFLLSLPNISFNVSPRKQFTALHAPVVGRFRYNYFDEFELAGPGDVFKELLAKWQSREELEAREIRGYTALHFACLSRDVVATGLILRAMKRVGADVNIMTNLFWSPVWKTPLDLVEDRDRAPSPVVNRGAEAVERYNAKTADLRRMLTSAGGKHRAAALGNKWGSLSFVERIKAVLLSNRFTRPFAVVGEFFYTVWISGMDAFTSRMRFWAQSNPDEVQYRRH